MRLLFVPFAFLIGCNALTGASDLEEVPCTTDCTDATTAEVAIDSAPEETLVPDTTAVETMAIDDGKCMLDKQCDDGDACTKDTCSAGTCSNAKVDDDGDGESPKALGMCGLDCNDQNKEVSSKQVEWFSEGYPVAAADADGGTDAGTISFDYDCNGVEEKERGNTYKCTYSGGKCSIVEGWSGSPPACGATGSYVIGCSVTFASICQPTATSKSKQRCR